MRKAILGVLLLCFGTAGVAAADPVNLTSGGLFVSGDGSGDTLSGSANGFRASGSGFGTGSETSFNVGDTVSWSGEYGFDPQGVNPGFITVGGMTYQGYVHGNFQVNATPFVVADADSGAFDATFTTTFTLAGLLSVYGDLHDPSPLFTQAITSQGTASMLARQINPGQFLARDGLRLTFGPASNPSPTPEPASLLLLATGVAPLLLRRRG